MTRAEQAKHNFQNGYNCAQAVACAFSDVFGMEDLAVKRITTALGGGFGGMRYICGAVMGGGTVLSWAMDGSDSANKKEIYAEAKGLADRFAEEFGTCICKELLGGYSNPVPSERTAEYYEKRPCAECCCFACPHRHITDQPVYCHTKSTGSRT